MSSDKSDVSIIDREQESFPWWAQRIETFEGLDIIACKVIGHGQHGEEFTWPCKPEEATCWVVYGLYHLHGVAGGHERLASFIREADAKSFCKKLKDTFSNLSS